METNHAVTALAALAQASRLSIFRALVQAGPEGLAAGRISALTAIAPSALSFHLKELSHAGLLQSRQVGRFVIYSTDFAVMNALLGYLSDNCCAGAPCEASPAACCPATEPCP